MNIKPLAAAVALAVALATSGLAHADETGPQLKVSGYGTVADDANAGFRRAANIAKGTTRSAMARPRPSSTSLPSRRHPARSTPTARRT